MDFYTATVRRKKAPQARASTESQHCSICNQGHSPATNQIVLCDSCNTPYHQLCHDPPIPNDVLRNRNSASQSTTPWYCKTCEAKRSVLFPRSSWEVSVPASQFPLETVNEYLNLLPHSHLVNMIWSTVQHYPDARLFPPNLPQLVEEDKARRRQVGENRLQVPASTRRASKSPASMLSESTNKRKRENPSAATAAFSYAESDDSETSDHGRRSLRKSKTPRLHTAEVGISTINTTTQGVAGGSESTPSPSKGNATTQTDDYITTDEKMRFPTHPEDRPGSMSYFEMLRNALRDINDPEGVPPRRLYEWISE